jgi:hypothetical protein
MPISANSVRKAWGALGFAALLAAAAIIWNQPARKHVGFDITCEAFTAPATLSLNLNRYPSALVSAEGYGLMGTLEGGEIRFASGEGPLARTGIRKLTLSAPAVENAPVSYLRFVRSGDMGKMSLAAGQGVRIGAVRESGGPPSIAVSAQDSAEFRLTVGSQHIEIQDAERYNLSEIRVGQLFDQFHAISDGNLALLNLEGNADRRAKVSLTFAPTSAELALLTGPFKMPAGSRLPFTRALNPSLWVNDRPATGIVTDQRIDLTIEAERSELDAIALAPSADKQGAPALHITGTGEARSVRQGGHELLPTGLEQVLDEPLSGRTLSLLALGAVAALVLKTVDYALGVLLERYIPKG